MKKPAFFLIIFFLFISFLSVAGAEDAATSFKSTYLETAHKTHELMEMTGRMMASPGAELNSVTPVVNSLIQQTEILKKLSLQFNRKEGETEARLMKTHLLRIKQTAESGTGKAEITAALSNYYLHFNQLLMVTPLVLKDILRDHLDELNEAISQNDTAQIAHATEHFHIHANQMYYAAMFFGKKIWQKFSNRIREDADKLTAALKAGDKETMKKLVADLEKPVHMLQKIVKE